MGIGKTISGVILLAIGLSMVIGGGALGISPFLKTWSGQSYTSDTIAWFGGIIIFWIGMVPTIFGIRFISQPSTIREIEDRIDSLMKNYDQNMKIKTDFQKQLDCLRNDLEEEIKKH